MATYRVAGSVTESSGYKELRLKRVRSGTIQNTMVIPLSYVDGVANYDVTDQLKAELANYNIELYGWNGSSETLIRRAMYVLAGDVYIIEGQSNAVANLRGTYSSANDANTTTNSPNRWWVRVYGSASPTMSYTKGWYQANGNVWYDVNGACGQWGVRLASNIAGAQRVPIALFNGAYPGAPISYFQRNDNQPEDPNTNYGRLLARLREAGCAENVRAVFWYQGESDAAGTLNPNQTSLEQYKASFTNLYNDWKTDYPSISRFFIFQIRNGCGIYSKDGVLQIQEAQRQLAKELANTHIMTTNNTSQLFDGGTIDYCHYNFPNGYREIGDWMAKIVRKYLYGVTNQSSSIEVPEPSAAKITAFNDDGSAKELTLTLKDQYSTYTLDGDVKSEFRLEGGNFTIDSVKGSSNRLILYFKRANVTNNDPTGISYLSHDGIASPIVRNSSGVGLIHFSNFPVENPGSGGNNPPPVVCADAFEPNDIPSLAKHINNLIQNKGSISSATDVDWFTFKTYSSWIYIKISFSNLTADYDLYLYDNALNQLASSEKTGTSNEAFIYNGATTFGTYYLKVVPKTSQVDPSTCYSIRIDASSAPYSTSSPPILTQVNGTESPMEEVAMDQNNQTNFYPNPATDKLYINHTTSKAGPLSLRIIDLSGRTMIQQNHSASKGRNTYDLDVSKFVPGVYILQIQEGSKTTIKKITIGMQ
ncbi:T9SS type A sorting domain-containing protein [Flavihumibacter rivuli]|uniref:sialate O-acetylesterase n=1 Tax=Flavihumibacter rivuli TaxID=2838156 RepID=UPI001BDE75D8|nr:sialate O-acetylesterase [Flavihumibacter rivuli]ULQ56077.1 T9SS type A sorting domain-containing protein [Flavihumibacter rivuli]